MRLRQVVGVALVSAAAVVGTDLLMHSSLLRLLRPQILSPADGAIVNGPVTVSWDGPQPMQATLTGNGQRIDLGRRDSPFEIDPTRFPRPGQYGVELAAPRFGSVVRADRRFMVRRAPLRGAAVPSEEGGELSAPPGAAASTAELDELSAERDRLRIEMATLQGELTATRRERDNSEQALDAVQQDSDARAIAAQAQREELAREHLLALQENQALRQRLASIAPCTVWGYVSVPRPQSGPPSRVVLVSDRAGNVFRSEMQCASVRRGDPTGISPCLCVGANE
ncbi:MAG: hypothetical protein SF182_13025 [Deltaproteobacteria bacterium]|nr:hypothetical protein [Deltaproteobacteria bacterium]